MFSTRRGMWGWEHHVGLKTPGPPPLFPQRKAGDDASSSSRKHFHSQGGGGGGGGGLASVTCESPWSLLETLLGQML